MRWSTPERKGKKALVLLVLTLGLTVGSLAISAPTAEARWVRRARASALGAPVPAGVGAALTLALCVLQLPLPFSHRQVLTRPLVRSRVDIPPLVAALAGLRVASPRGRRAEGAA
jgi:hypothetical protein